MGWLQVGIGHHYTPPANAIELGKWVSEIPTRSLGIMLDHSEFSQITDNYNKFWPEEITGQPTGQAGYRATGSNRPTGQPGQPGKKSPPGNQSTLLRELKNKK